MAIKRRNKISASFSMSSMTDLVFLLLIFFMITSTVVTPSAIKLTLPQSSSQAVAKPKIRVTIDAEKRCYVAEEKEADQEISIDELEAYLQNSMTDEKYVVLYADETVPYGDVVKVLDIANSNKYKLVIATRPGK